MLHIHRGERVTDNSTTPTSTRSNTLRSKKRSQNFSQRLLGVSSRLRHDFLWRISHFGMNASDSPVTQTHDQQSGTVMRVSRLQEEAKADLFPPLHTVDFLA